MSLLIIGMATDMKTIDEVVASNKQGADRLKEKYRNFKPTSGVEIIQWDGQPAVKGNIELPGRFSQESYEFLIGNQYYMLSYAAPPSLYSKYKEQAMLSIKSLDPILKKLSSSDARLHLAASKLRIAQLNIQIGRRDLALRAVNEGLEVNPGQKELLELKQKLKEK